MITIDPTKPVFMVIRIDPAIRMDFHAVIIDRHLTYSEATIKLRSAYETASIGDLLFIAAECQEDYERKL